MLCIIIILVTQILFFFGTSFYVIACKISMTCISICHNENTEDVDKNHVYVLKSLRVFVNHVMHDD